MRQPRERRGIGMCVRCMCEWFRVEEGLSRREQLASEVHDSLKLSKQYSTIFVK